jgi:DNA-binding response OmpR family regulator
VLRQVRADAATAAVPVIVVSIVDERARGMALGASAYLVKPVQRDILLGALRDVGALAALAAEPS